MKSIFVIFVAIVLMALGMSFYTLNDQIVRIDYYFDVIESARLPVVILVAFGIGVLVGCFATLGLVFSKKREIRKLKKIQKENEEELTNLRNLPLKDDGIGTELADV